MRALPGDEEVRRLMALVDRRVLSRYREWADYDDLASAAYYGMWLAVRQVSRNEACANGTAAVWGARSAVRDYRLHQQTERERLPLVSLEAAIDEDGIEWAIEPDFSGRVIARQEEEKRWQEVRAVVTPIQWEVIAAVLRDGISLCDYAEATQVPYDTLRTRLQAGLRRYREAYGIDAGSRPPQRWSARRRPHPTHCCRGHRYTPETTGIRERRGQATLYCRICQRERSARRRQ